MTLAMPTGWLWLLTAASLLPMTSQGGEILINLTNQVWRYNQSGINPGPFEASAFDDSGWPQGRSILAYEDSTSTPSVVSNILPYTNTVLTAPVAGGPIVVYFRTHFNFTGDPNTTLLTASNLVDDGYIMYLNGVEASVFNMNASRTLAAQASPQPEGIYVVTKLCYPVGTLHTGDNVLAVAVYQNTATSSDVVWGTVLHASAGSSPTVSSPTAPVSIPLKQGSSTNLNVTVQATPCATYQWYFDPPGPPLAAPISGAAATSYTIANMDQSKAGGYFLRSMNAVGTTDSPSFNVSFNQDFTSPVLAAATASPLDLSRITVTFSEDVIDTSYTPFDPYAFYLEGINDPNNFVGVADTAYGVASNIVTLTLSSPRDPGIRYQLVISNHRIEDRFGNPLSDPAIVRVTVPIVFQDGNGGYAGTQDTQLEQAAPDVSHGNDATLVCDGSPLNHGLLRFDNLLGDNPGQVPRGAFINQATLRIYTDDPSDRATPVRMLRMRVPWNESSTWNSVGNGIDETNGVEAGVTDALVVADITTVSWK